MTSVFPDDRPIPGLRHTLDIIPTQYNKQPMLLIRDREALVDSQLIVSQAALFLASLFDGRRTAAQVRGEFFTSTGRQAGEEELDALVRQLSAAGFLETSEVRALRQKRADDFRAAATRPAAHQGSVYPADRGELEKMLDSFFVHPKGPGKIIAKRPLKKQPLLGLFAPHIDFTRGGPAYAWAYGALAETPPPDVIVALGVAHMSPPTPWVLTPKPYETPYGLMNVAKDLYENIQSVLDYDTTQDEVFHRDEHSLEFQAVWLRFLWGEKTPPWIPILCSSLETHSGADSTPASVPYLESMIQGVGEVLKRRASQGERILILAGIDLAHVGPRFGDRLPMTPETEALVEKEDRRSLEAALRLDADAFYRSVIADDHWRKVCGLAAFYTALRWTKALAGASKNVHAKLLTYGQAPDPMGGLVSFASGFFAPL